MPWIFIRFCDGRMRCANNQMLTHVVVTSVTQQLWMNKNLRPFGSVPYVARNTIGCGLKPAICIAEVSRQKGYRQMATYEELFNLRTNTALRNKLAVAAVIKAQAYVSGATPTLNQLTWAENTFANPLSEADELMNYVLAANKDLTVSQISGASDSAMQTQVNTAVEALVTGGIV
jgi:hypothetical protein